MKLPENKTLAIGAVVITTVLLQIPGLDEWYGRVSKEYTHIVTLVEGIVGVLMVLWATVKGKPASISAGGAK